MNIINPTTEEVIKTIAEDNVEQITSKYQLLLDGQPLWAGKELKERITIISKFKQLLLDNIDALSETLTSETGKPLWQAKNEVRGAAGRIDFFINNSAKYLAEEVVNREEGLTELIAYEPLGIIANISAWNYPYLVGTNVFIPALIAGNAVLYKPSEFATLTGLKIQEMFYQAGVPENAFQIVLGGGAAGAALLELPLDGYFFTGSYNTGKLIYEKVATKMVPCQLELGGKDPLYVTDDNQNIDTVAAAGVEGAFYNNGQSCCSVERIYVHEKVYDEYVAAFVKEAANWKLGDPMEEGTFISPLTRKQQLDVLEDQVADALSKGAKLVAGGKRVAGTGYYFEPTVLVDVDHTMKLMHDESFGPIIGIQKVSSDEEAVKLMKDTEYGLASAVYTDSLDRAEKLLKQMDSGSAYWNCCDRVSANLPWSGRRNSGIGATLSYIGIRAFTKPKGYHMRG